MTETLINTESQYKKYLGEVERLIGEDPLADSAEGERLSLLSLAIQDYEANRYFFRKPTPVEAIRFRMEEQGLNQNDLVSFIGSKSKVSEILSEKRKLTLPMIRALNKYLGIPFSVLIQEPEETSFNISLSEIEWSKFPVLEMIKRKWIKEKALAMETLKNYIEDFLNPREGVAPQAVLWKRALNYRTETHTDKYSLLAWLSRISFLAKQQIKVTYDPRYVSMDFLREVGKLSQFKQGPLLAREMLGKYGIKLIFERHLPKTKLDGGCFMDLNGNPVIGMTLRYDRLDNFWYTLLHELVHVYKHLGNCGDVYLDDLEYDWEKNLKEQEADKLAREAFIPRAIWKRSEAFALQTEKEILVLAKQLNIHPAIVAGRIRFDSGDYSRFADLIGQGEVRKMFGVK
jgi:HTH-type transcriptional regulator / antitoxin HigA